MKFKFNQFFSLRNFDKFIQSIALTDGTSFLKQKIAFRIINVRIRLKDNNNLSIISLSL